MVNLYCRFSLFQRGFAVVSQKQTLWHCDNHTLWCLDLGKVLRQTEQFQRM
jgi:hypothetical protein